MRLLNALHIDNVGASMRGRAQRITHDLFRQIVYALDQDMPVEAHLYETPMFFQDGETFNWISRTRPNMVWPTTFGATPQILQHRCIDPRRLFERPANACERHEQHRFSRLYQPPPL